MIKRIIDISEQAYLHVLNRQVYFGKRRLPAEQAPAQLEFL